MVGCTGIVNIVTQIHLFVNNNDRMLEHICLMMSIIMHVYMLLSRMQKSAAFYIALCVSVC
jgi:hypothetical protein